MSDIFCLVHVLCAVTYVRCSWHIFHSSVDLGDLARALFPIIVESMIPQSSSFGRSCKYFSHVCSASLRCACAALVHLVRARSLSFGITLAKCAWVVPSFRSVLACAMSTCSSRFLLLFHRVLPSVHRQSPLQKQGTDKVPQGPNETPTAPHLLPGHSTQSSTKEVHENISWQT